MARIASPNPGAQETLQWARKLRACASAAEPEAWPWKKPPRPRRPSRPRDRQLPQIVRALRNPNFRLFWSGNFLSNIGTWMQNVAQGWLVLSLTGSAFWLGVVGFAGSIPFLVFTLFGGVVADRVNKRRLLLVTQSVMMLLAFALAALAWFKVITVWELVAIAFLNGMAMAMNAPSYQALVPRLVPREDLTNAIALNSAQFNMSRILGPTLGGYAMALFGVAGNFFLNGVSFLAVLWALTRIAIRSRSRRTIPDCFRASKRASPMCAPTRRCACWCG
jgi:MFS family permease